MSRKMPLIGKSGLPWNSLVFGHGTSPSAFETWRNRPVDGVLYFPARRSWDDLGHLPPRRADDMVVYSIPPFPAGGSNSELAAGAYDSAIATFAATFLAAGWDTPRTAIRLGWEVNGDWYEWGWAREGVPAAVAGFQRFVTVARNAGMTQTRWEWNLNKGPSSSTAGYDWTIGYPGDEYVDVIGIDPYDMWQPTYTEAEWASTLRNKNPGLDDIADFAQAHGKQVAIDEWGVVHANGGGYDNPFYIAKMGEWLRDNCSLVAWESTYDFGDSKLSAGLSPRAAEQYRKAYPNGWGR